jgi:hypothetical protein
METGKTPSPKITHDPPASGKKPGIYKPRHCFWEGGKVRRCETYLLIFLGKSDEKNSRFMHLAKKRVHQRVRMIPLRELRIMS